MSILASVDDLREYMSGINLRSDQTAAGTYVLDGVEATIIRYLRRPIQVVTVTDEVCFADDQGIVYPLITPVVSLLSVFDSQPLLRDPKSRNCLLGAPYGMYRISYKGGLPGVSLPDLRLIELRVAAREMQNKHDDAYTSKNLERTDEDPKPISLQADDKASLNGLRRRSWTWANSAENPVGIPADWPATTYDPSDDVWCRSVFG